MKPFGAGSAAAGSPFLNYVKRTPLGVVAQITPWNHPLLICVKKLAAALAAGCTTVVKPSELAPASVVEFARLCSEQAALPPGVFNVVVGDGMAGAALVDHPAIAKVDFTGGPDTGRAIGAACGRNLAGYVGELGGKSPMVVFGGAGCGETEEQRLDRVVNGVVFGCFIASGQTCIAGTRLIVEESIREQFLQKLVAKVSKLTVGDPVFEGTNLGPVITERQLGFLEEMVAKGTTVGTTDAGDEGTNHDGGAPYAAGEVLIGGRRKTAGFSCENPSDATETALSRGNFFEPTVVFLKNTSAKTAARPEHNPLFQTELFGPVLTVTSFSTEEEAIRLANATEFGLGCSIWTEDLGRAHRVADRIDAGIIWINDHHKNDPSSPWGGLKKASGLGRENGVDAFHEYTQAKSVVVNTNRYADDWFGGGRRYN